MFIAPCLQTRRRSIEGGLHVGMSDGAAGLDELCMLCSFWQACVWWSSAQPGELCASVRLSRLRMLAPAQSVHVKNRCAFLNHSSNAGEFMRAGARAPQHPPLVLGAHPSFTVSLLACAMNACRTVQCLFGCRPYTMDHILQLLRMHTKQLAAWHCMRSACQRVDAPCNHSCALSLSVHSPACPRLS